MQAYTCYIKPAAGDETRLSIPLPPSESALISGTVTSEDTPVPDALVLLLTHPDGVLLAHTVTDESGRFWFGPLPPDTLYLLRVQKSASRIREVELRV